MSKTVLFMFLNLFSLAVLGLPTDAKRGLTANIGGVIAAGFDAPGALLTLHASDDCSGASLGSYYLLSAQPIWNNPTGNTLSISVGSNSDSTQVNFYSQANAAGSSLGSTTGNNVCAHFGADISSAELVLSK